MTRALMVHQAGPAVTLQDMGRPGFLADGLSQGGAADRTALWEGAALLGQPETYTALELAGFGGRFEAAEDLRIALTGAPMHAKLDDGSVLRWNASHLLPKGATLALGATMGGSYGYLHVGGGFATPTQLGAMSAHIAAGLGDLVTAGAVLPVGADSGADVNMAIEVAPRGLGGTVHMVPSLQTDLFGAQMLDLFQATEFTRDTRGNRMGVRLLSEGLGFSVPGGLTVLSEVIAPGDIQVTGEGTPFVLLAECQTTGGYPRIGSVIPSDLPIVAQAPAGAKLRFKMLSLDAAVEREQRALRHRHDLRKTLKPLLRNPADIRDLLSYQLISGVTAGDDLDGES